MTEHQSEQLLWRAKKMREAQKNYFKNKSQSNLITAKQRETDLDNWIKEIEESKQPQQELFT